MVRKNDRYYLAIGLGQYIVEGHTKVEALEEFDISRSAFDRALEYLESCNYKLYILAKSRLNQNMYLKAQVICEFIVAGHTKIEATKEFSTSLSSIDRCIEVIHNRNDELYQKVKKQLRQNMNISNSTSI